jgi:hypothetical protein
VRRVVVALVGIAACGGDDGLEYRGAPVPVRASFRDLLPEVLARVDGREPEAFLCDSGSPLTLLDRTTFPDLADGVHRVTLEAFGLTFPRYRVAAWDAFGGIESAGGIVGGDLLGHFAFSMDYQGGRVWLGDPFDPAARPSDVRAAPETRVPMEVAGGGFFALPGGDRLDVPATRVVLPARFEGQTTPVWVVVDSGASGVVVDEALLEALGDAARRPRLDGAIFYTVNGATPGAHARVWRLTLGSGAAAVSLDDVPVMLAPGFDVLESLSREIGRPARALVGGSYLRHFLATLDYPGRALRLARYDDPSHVPGDEWVGVGVTFQRDGDEWLAREVYTGRDAHAKGLRPGDAIEAIGGFAVRGQPGEALDARLADYLLGDEVEIEYRREGAPATVRVLVEDLLPHYPPPP